MEDKSHSTIGKSSLKVRYTYRLRVSKSAEGALLSEWGGCRWVWNQCVATSRKAHEERTECGPAYLSKQLTGWRAENEWLRAGSSVVQQQTIRDFGAARAKAISDIKAGLPMHQRRGLPKFKKRDKSLPSMNYTMGGFSISGGRLNLSKGVSAVVVWSRPLPSTPRSVRISKDAVGHWWASFVVEIKVEPLPGTGRAIGIDWGVRETATTTDPAFNLAHAEHGKKVATKLAKYQRQIARRKPQKGKASSNGYKTAKTHAAKVYEQARLRRQDDRLKWAKGVVRAHDQIAVEDFKPKFLAKSTTVKKAQVNIARKAADAAIAAAKCDLIWMATKHQRDLRLVDPAGTTQDCSGCGARAKHRLELSKRTYVCENCGLVKPRDRNSAAVMVARAGFNPAGVDRIRPESPLGPQAA